MIPAGCKESGPASAAPFRLKSIRKSNGHYIFSNEPSHIHRRIQGRGGVNRVIAPLLSSTGSGGGPPPVFSLSRVCQDCSFSSHANEAAAAWVTFGGHRVKVESHSCIFPRLRVSLYSFDFMPLTTRDVLSHAAIMSRDQSLRSRRVARVLRECAGELVSPEAF